MDKGVANILRSNIGLVLIGVLMQMQFGHPRKIVRDVLSETRFLVNHVKFDTE